MGRWSRYNIAVPEAGGEGYLFNARTGALVSLEPARWSEVTTGAILGDDLYGFLSRHGFIVDDDVDEIALIDQTYERARASTASFSATVELTEACNFRCRYCYQGHARKHLDADTVERVVLFLFGKMTQHSHVHVNWFGGEPLLRLNVLRSMSERLTAEARRSDCELSQFITTNGYLLTASVARDLAELGIGNVQITLDGQEAVHDRLRPLASGRATYARVREACVNVVRAGIDLMVRVNVNRLNAGTIGQLLDDLLDAGITPRNAVIHAVRAVNHGNCDSPMAEACFEAEEFARRWVRILAEVASRGFGLPTLDPRPYNCPFDMLQTVMIGSDGMLRHCSSSDSVLATLDEHGMEASPTPLLEKIKFRRPIDDKACRVCVCLPMCMGGCSYLGELGMDRCNPERWVLGELVALTARQGHRTTGIGGPLWQQPRK